MPRVHPHPAFEPERIEGRHHQAREPLAAFRRFPPPGFRMAPSTRHGLLETMHTAFGQARLLGQTPHTLLAVLTKTLENPGKFHGPRKVDNSFLGRASAY